MFRDYESLVVAHYHQKMTLNELSPRLIEPTPASLRDECVAVFSVRNGRKDEGTLRIFFKVRDNESLSEKQIERCDISIFKPLVNYLKNGTGKTERKNIELLAWLIDFQPRPFVYGRKYGPISLAKSIGVKEEMNVDADGKEEGETEAAENVSIMKTKSPIHMRIYGNPYFKSVMIAVFAFAALATAGNWIYGWWNNKDLRKGLAGLQRCMYWAGDHYEQVSCNEKFGYDTMVVAFDSVKFHNLKRVTSPDTITLNAVGKVWYIKKDNEYKYYTSEGLYPEDPKFRLRPITAYIIEKHILKGQ